MGEAPRLGAFWAVITIVVDLIGWVLIKHPWSMTFKQMYVDYQPWDQPDLPGNIWRSPGRPASLKGKNELSGRNRSITAF